MNKLVRFALVALLTVAPGAALALQTSAVTPAAVIADPPADPKFPARMEVIHVPSGGVKVNGVVYVAAGPGPHPTFVFFHGLPGNERNLDLAQAVRRAGWNAVAINYRGSWGSPGNYRFAQNLEDADAAMAFIRDPANAKALNIDVSRIAIGGHSMGGWVTAHTLAHEPGVLGGVVISSGDAGRLGLAARKDLASVTRMMDDNRESLAGVTGESMAREVAANADAWTFTALAPRLVDRRLLVLHSNDFVLQDSLDLVAAIKAAGGKKVEAIHAPTDHSWSDKRILLQSLVVNWLQQLLARPQP